MSLPEMTQQKLDEIKRLRMVPKADEPPPNPPLPPDLVTGVGGLYLYECKRFREEGVLSDDIIYQILV